MKIAEIKHIKKLYSDYLFSNKLDDRDRLILYYVDLGADAELLGLVSDILNYDKFVFYSSIQYTAYLSGYNLNTEKKITQLEMISVDLLLMDYDEETGNPIIYSDFERFEIYKKEFLD